MKLRQHIRRALKWLALGLLILLLLAAALFGLLQTGYAKRLITAKAAAWLSANLDAQVTVGRLTGLLPFSARLDRFALADDDGVWLSVQDGSVRWSPLALLAGRIHVDEIALAEVRIERLPEGEGETEWPSVPEKLPLVTVERFSIGKAILGEAVASQELIVRMDGRVESRPSGAELALAAELEGAGPAPLSGSATISFATAPKPSLDLSVRYREDPGGLLAKTSGVAFPDAIEIALAGEGPLEGWAGNISFGLGGKPIVKSSLGIALSDTLSLSGQGDLTPPPSLLPGSLRAMVHGPSRFAFDVERDTDGTVRIRRLAVSAPFVEATCQGRLDISAQTASLTLELGADDLAVLEPLLGIPLQGRLEAQGAIDGAFLQPVLNVSMTITEPALAGCRAERLTAELEVTALAPIEAPLPQLAARGSLRVAGLTADVLPTLPRDDYDCSFAFETRADQRVAIDALSLEGRGLRLEVSGAAALDTLTGSFQAAMRSDDVAAIAGPFGFPLHGRAEVSARLEGDLPARSCSLFVDGALRDPSGIPEPLRLLLGDEVRLRGRGELVSGRLARVADLEIAAEHGRAAVNGAYDLGDASLEANVAASFPDIALLGDAVGHRLAGAVNIKGEVSGTLPNLQGHLAVEAEPFTLDAVSVDRVEIELSAEAVPGAPCGAARVCVVQGEDQLVAKADYAVEAPRVKLTGLRMTMPGAEAAGALTVDLDARLAQGDLRADAEDLAWLGRLAGQALEGRATLDLALETDGPQQNATLDLHLHDLATPFGAVAQAQLTAALTDLLNAPSGNLEFHAQDIRKGQIVVDRLEATLDGGMDRAAFAASVQGTSKGPFTFETHGECAASQAAFAATIQAFQGEWAGLTVALEEPMAIRADAGGFAVDQLALQLASGRLTASAAYADGLDLEIAFQGIPLDLAQQAGAPVPLVGEASGRLRIHGPLDRPEADAELLVADLRVGDPRLDSLPPAELAAAMALHDGRLTAEFTLADLLAKPVEATIALPVHASLAPFAAGVAPDGQVEGAIRFEGRLETIAALMLLDGQRIDGLVRGNLRVDGPLHAPVVSGEVAIEDAAYENFATGTVLAGLNATVRGRGRRLELLEAEATDGGDGTLTASGWLDVDPSQGFPFSLTLECADATLVRRDDVTATAGGAVTASGSLDQAKVAGNVTIGPAQIYLPEPPPQQLAGLEVIEAHGTAAPQAPTPPEDASPLDNVSVELEVDLPGRVFLRGPGLESEWAGNLGIQGPAAEPEITGQLSLVRGDLTFLDKRFKLVEGAVLLDGAYPPSPVVAITAQAKAGDVTAVVKLAGPIAALDVVLESKPPLPQDEVLARVLFGQGLTRLSPVQAVRIARYAAALSKKGRGLDVLTQTQRSLGLDRLGLTQTGDDAKDVGVGVGKYLSDGVYLNVEQGLGRDSGRVGIEIEITPNLSVESTVEPDAGGGVEVHWKRDY